MKVFLLGKMGSGKSSVKDYLCQHYGFTRAVTLTTRKPRPAETEDVDYHFVSTETFLDLLQKGEILEYDQHHGVYYGSLKSNYENDTNIVFTLSPKALSSFQDLELPEHISIYLKVDPEVQKERILHRRDDLKIANKRIQDEIKEYDNIESLVDSTILVSHKSLSEICLEIVEKLDGTVCVCDK